MKTRKASPEFVRAAKRENELRQKRDSWSVLLFGFSVAAIFITLATIVVYRTFPTQKFGIKFTAIVASIWLLAEIVAIVGYAHARSRHLRAEEDLDVVCQTADASQTKPRD